MQKKFSKILSWVLALALIVPNLGITARAETSYETQFNNFITVDTVDGTKLMDGDEELKFISLNSVLLWNRCCLQAVCR